MRIVFMGTPQFAVPSLEALLSVHDVVAVYTRPDSVSGRGGRLRPGPVKTVALEAGIDVFQPPTLRDETEHARLIALEPDLVVVAAYGLILPREVLEAPRLGCINVHGSLLPRWRGAAPVERAMLAGDRSTGVSIMRVEEGLDTGPYCVQREIAIADHTAASLTDALSVIGAAALLEALAEIESGAVVWTQQDESLVTYADKITRNDVSLSADMSVVIASRRIRASSRRAASRIQVGDKALTVVSVTPNDADVTPGTVAMLDEGPVLGFADGGLLLVTCRPDGKSDMDGAAFARGARLESGTTWSTL